MEVRLVHTPSAAMDSEPALCVFAIELSKASWSIGVQKPSGGKIGPISTGCRRCERIAGVD
jgi:hypothetical protein